MRRVTKEMLSNFDGTNAYNGALRFWDEYDLSLIQKWSGEFGNLFPQRIVFFGADAFGALYGVDEEALVSIFWAETGELEPLGICEAEFYGIIASDPDGTISLGLYNQAASIFGRPNHMQDFAFKVETALGGKAVVENIYVCDRIEHLKALGKIARQINEIEIGTKLNVRPE